MVSSRIEGTVATLDEVLDYEAEAEGGEGHAPYRQEVIEVFSYGRAMNHAQRLVEQGLPLCGRFIKEAHGRLLFFGRGADKQPGSFKRDQNFVVDRTKRQVLFVPISPQQLDDGIAKLERFIHNEEIEPLVQTALAHVEFEALHPFKDGNGRVGRMLITLMLWDKKLISAPHFYASGPIERRKDEYIDRLRLVSMDQQWTEWCLFFLGLIEEQASENLKAAETIVQLYEAMKVRFREELVSQWSIPALDFIFSRPVFRNSAFTRDSGIPRPTAARFTKVLAERGLLTTVEAAAGRRPALYAFEPLLQLVRG